MSARVEAAPTDAGWTNVRLDDNDALPSWLRAIPQVEHAPSVSDEPLFSMEPPVPSVLAVDLERPAELALPAELDLPARPAHTFAEPLEAGAMRLVVADDSTNLLDQPGDLGVVLTTLIAGDEVEIQDIEEPWVRVLTPIGSTGWLRSASLGFGGAPPDAALPEEPVPGEPQEPSKSKRRGARQARRPRSARPAT